MELMNDSGEYWERNGLTVQDKDSTHQQPSLPEPVRTMNADLHNAQAGQKAEINWKPLYPEIIEPSQEFDAPKGPQLNFESKVATTNEDSPPQTPPQETVQPLEVFRTQGCIPQTSIPLANVLTRAGQSKSSLSKAEPASSQSVPRGGATGKAPRQNPVSASDATIEVVKKALAGAKITDVSPDRATHQDSERNYLPNGRISPRDSLSAVPNSAVTSRKGSSGHTTSMDASREEQARDSEAQKKALEVLKVIRELGYTVQKDTSHSPRLHNLGSAASSRSENLVTCQKCQRFTGRPCELKYVF